MVISHRIRPAFLIIAGAGALINLAVSLLAPQNGRIDWVLVGVPLGLLVGVASSALEVPGKARIILSLLSIVLCLSSAGVILLRMTH